LLNPAAKHGRRNAKKKDGKREDPTSWVSFQSFGVDWEIPSSLVIGKLNTLKA
jgi:hypothetical protein